MRYARSCAKSRGSSSGREMTCADSLTILVASCSCCSPSDFTQNPNGKVNERNRDVTPTILLNVPPTPRLSLTYQFSHVGFYGNDGTDCRSVIASQRLVALTTIASYVHAFSSRYSVDTLSRALLDSSATVVEFASVPGCMARTQSWPLPGSDEET